MGEMSVMELDPLQYLIDVGGLRIRLTDHR